MTTVRVLINGSVLDINEDVFEEVNRCFFQLASDGVYVPFSKWNDYENRLRQMAESEYENQQTDEAIERRCAG